MSYLNHTLISSFLFIPFIEPEPLDVWSKNIKFGAIIRVLFFITGKWAMITQDYNDCNYKQLKRGKHFASFGSVQSAVITLTKALLQPVLIASAC